MAGGATFLMPLELPGFYFDVARNRYFPLNSSFSSSTHPTARSEPAPQETPFASANEAVTSLKTVFRDRNTKLKRDMMTALGGNERWTMLHKLQSSNMANMVAKCSSVAPYDGLGVDLTSLAVSEKGLFAGDKAGMLYFGSSEQPLSPWSVHFHLESQITSVHAHRGTTYAASLGPNPQILITTEEYTARFGMHAFHDVWSVHWITSDLPVEMEDTTTTSVGSAVLGMKQRAVYMPSLETHRGCYIMPTNSDIFAVHKHHAQILTGARNGSVKLFDIRAPPQSHCTIFQPCVRTGRNPGGWDSLSAPKSQQRRTPSPSKSAISHSKQVASPTGHTSAVTNLSVVHEWGLLLGAMDGTLAVYDIRFCGTGSSSSAHRNGSSETGPPRPVMTLPGHVNTHSQSLGFYVDPSSNFVLAAGEDCRVRAWSLKTGDPVFPVSQPNSNIGQPSSQPRQAFNSGDKGLLFLKKFARPVNALVSSNSGKDLWVASGRNAFCFESPLQIVG